MTNNIILVGSGAMSIEYAKVLNSFDFEFEVIGRGEISAKNFNKFIKKKVHVGGIDKNQSAFNSQSLVINAVNVENLYETTLSLINKNVKRILIEKPGSLKKEELTHLLELSQKRSIDVFVAYNRRFYNSVTKVREIIKNDGGLKACFFEFSEFSKKIELSNFDKAVKEKWLIANSSHVIDTVFFISGKPMKNSFYIRKGDIKWHKSGVGFSGSGITDKGVLYSYMSNWDCPGRWGIEFITSKRRILLSPMEKIKQKYLNDDFVEIKLDDDDDIRFKPGVAKLLKSFLSKNDQILCKLEEQISNIEIYNKMAGYK